MFSRQSLTFFNRFKKISKSFVKINILISRNSFSDVVIIGGGAMGSSVAYWLKENSKEDLKITVIEKDPTYSSCSTCLSVGGIRHQFAIAENVQMSLFGSKFIETIKDRFGLDADISYRPFGYLILASSQGAQQLVENYELQKQLGANSQLLTKKQLKKRFDWMNVDDVELGCLGGKREGWFDPWKMLSLLRQGAIDKGVEYIQGEITDFVFEVDDKLKGVRIQLPNKESKLINFNNCVLAAGADSGDIAKLAGIGRGVGKLATPLPVEKRKRYVYIFDSQGDKAPKKETPLTIDFSGVYFRNDGTGYITGRSPDPKDEPATDNLDVDFEYFDSRIWPLLAHRIPAFESAKVRGAWGGYYEFNTFDENGIVGPHPVHRNLFFITGFSGHGIQQAPAAGLAVAEVILNGKFQTIDLSRMSFERIITKKPLYETEIY